MFLHLNSPYYTVSCFRDEKLVDRVREDASFVSELSTLIDNTGGIKFALNTISQPPGADYSDVYLLDHANYSPFLNKQEFLHYTAGTRENIKSALVEIPFSSNETVYIGIKNPDMMYGINVIISAAAIVLETEFGEKDSTTHNISYRTEYFLD